MLQFSRNIARRKMTRAPRPICSSPQHIDTQDFLSCALFASIASTLTIGFLRSALPWSQHHCFTCHPSGYIKGGKIAMSFPANRMLGVAFVGRNHVLSNWKFLFNSISWSLFFLFSWWLRRESRFFDARGLRDRVLRVRTPPALCEQLTFIFFRGVGIPPTRDCSITITGG